MIILTRTFDEFMLSSNVPVHVRVFKWVFHYDETKGIYVSGAEIVIESQAELITDGTVSTSIVNEAMNHRLSVTKLCFSFFSIIKHLF